MNPFPLLASGSPSAPPAWQETLPADWNDLVSFFLDERWPVFYLRPGRPVSLYNHTVENDEGACFGPLLTLADCERFFGDLRLPVPEKPVGMARSKPRVVTAGDGRHFLLNVSWFFHDYPELSLKPGWHIRGTRLRAAPSLPALGLPERFCSWLRGIRTPGYVCMEDLLGFRPSLVLTAAADWAARSGATLYAAEGEDAGQMRTCLNPEQVRSWPGWAYEGGVWPPVSPWQPGDGLAVTEIAQLTRTRNVTALRGFHEAGAVAWVGVNRQDSCEQSVGGILDSALTASIDGDPEQGPRNWAAFLGGLHGVVAAAAVCPSSTGGEGFLIQWLEMTPSRRKRLCELVKIREERAGFPTQIMARTADAWMVEDGSGWQFWKPWASDGSPSTGGSSGRGTGGENRETPPD